MKNDCTLNNPISCNNDGNADSGEICDGTDFGTYSCDSLWGLNLGGTLACNNCKISTTSCNKPSASNNPPPSANLCGNTQFDSGEQCDSSSVSGTSNCIPVGQTGQSTCMPA